MRFETLLGLRNDNHFFAKVPYSALEQKFNEFIKDSNTFKNASVFI